MPATRCMCPPRPPQHVPPWLPQHMSAMDDTARATPGCPQAGCHRHTATAHGGRGECPHCGASATAACLLHVLVALWVGLPWLPPPTMAATARHHHGHLVARLDSGTPRNGRHSTPTPTGMLPWLPAPWCTMQWPLPHAPHGPTMAATARPHHGCHSTPPAAMAACTWPPWAATWCGQCCPPTPLPWLPKHAPSVGRVGTAALGAQITPFLQTSWCS